MLFFSFLYQSVYFSMANALILEVGGRGGEGESLLKLEGLCNQRRRETLICTVIPQDMKNWHENLIVWKWKI